MDHLGLRLKTILLEIGEFGALSMLLLHLGLCLMF